MKKISKTALNPNAANMEARKRAKEERKREQQLAGIFLKPISKRSKTLLEKIVANVLSLILFGGIIFGGIIMEGEPL